jgi:hypothetical protein
MVSKKVTPKDDKKGLASADQETKKKVASKGGKAKAKATSTKATSTKATSTKAKATSTKATTPKKTSGSAKKK